MIVCIVSASYRGCIVLTEIMVGSDILTYALVIASVLAAGLFLLLFQHFILIRRYRRLQDRYYEHTLVRSPIYDDIISHDQDKICQLSSSIDSSNELIRELEAKIERLTLAIFHTGVAAEKILSLQKDKGNCNKKSGMKWQLSAEERNDLLVRVKLCRDDFVVEHESLTDDELILYHLITSGIDRSNIARLMGVTDGTLRQRKFRLVRKLEMLTSGQAL